MIAPSRAATSVRLAISRISNHIHLKLSKQCKLSSFLHQSLSNHQECRREYRGADSSISRSNFLVTKLSREGRIEEARKLFDKLPDRDLITWTSLITGYLKLGLVEEGRKLFDRSDSKKNVITWTAMVNGYLKSNRFAEAERLFQEMPVKNVVSWNTMIDGYARSGKIDRALELFDEMPDRNVVSWNSVITALAQRGRIAEARALFDTMPKRDVISWTALVAGLSKNGMIDEARTIFDRMPERNVVSWNAMVTGYTQNMRLDEALDLFEKMPERDPPSWNTMITGFIQNGEMDRAWKLFDEMPIKNVISWTTMITGYVNQGQSEEALNVFSKMVSDGEVKPNIGTFVSVLSACSDLAGLGEGTQIHQIISKSVHQTNEFVVSALINMYSKCGDLGSARKIFEGGSVNQRDSISWNGMITAYGHHGHGREAIRLFNQMRSHGFKPDEVTYLGLLSACSHAGLVDEGMRSFQELVNDKSLNLREDHYTCLVDMCGRAGRLTEAFDLIERLGAKPSESVWGAVFAACNVHGDGNTARRVSEKVLKSRFEPETAGTYMLLSNIYASTGKWREAAEMRLKMKDKGLKKQPGCSWIEIGNRTRVFVVGDKSHAQADGFYFLLLDLHSKMKMKTETEDDDCRVDYLLTI